MPVNPELVDATDLDAWAERRDAQELLPRLVRALLHATPGVSRISVRAGEGVGVPGWDGRADGGPGTGCVPAGPSGWEMGTGADPRAKAQSDYRKRTENPEGVDPQGTTFVFVTMRRWGAKGHKDDKDAWVQEKRAAHEWKDVVALDADDLEGWLEGSPAVHIWLSERTGRRPNEVQTLDYWWESWSTQMRPPLPAALLLAGRRKQADDLRQKLQAPAEVLGVHGGARDEVIAFLAASLLVPDEAREYAPEDDPLARTVVMSSPQAWARIATSASRTILVPSFDRADVGAAIRAGHHVIVPMGAADNKDRATIVLPRLARDEARDALRAAGWSFAEADKHAAQARRNLKSLLRELSLNPAIMEPTWARRPVADPLAPLMLVGSWAVGAGADRDIVASVAAADYGHLERTLKDLAATDDPPFRPSGGMWRLTAPLDAWTLLRRLLTADDISRWRNAALRVLSEQDPALRLLPADRPLASVLGATRTWSGELRRGLAQGAALLGVAGETPLADGPTGPEHADWFVRELLVQANEDASGRMWQSLADVLPLLAEAAPDQFLHAVEAGLAGEVPTLGAMFTDSEETPALGVSSPHTGLLWALESLCWSSEHVSRAVNALGRLAEIDPGGRLGNRPAASLRSVLIAWTPSTSAPLRRRIAMISGLLNRRPSVGWALLLALLPRGQDVAMPTYAPSFRDWKPDEQRISPTEYVTAIDELVGVALAAVGDRPGRWVQLVDHLQDFPKPELERSLEALEHLDDNALEPGERLALWHSLTKMVARHRQFSTADWALPDEPLRRLEEVAARFEPPDPAERYARLFDGHPDLPGTDKFDHEGYDRALRCVRHDAIRSTYQGTGPVGLSQLAEKSKLPRLVGALAAEVLGDALANEFFRYLAAEGPQRELAVGWTIRMFDLRGWTWMDSILPQVAGLPTSSRSALYLALPTEPRTWALVDDDVEEARAEYWRQVNRFDVNEGHAVAFADRLVAQGRPWSAIAILAHYTHRQGHDVEPAIEVIERALRAGLRVDSRETLPAGQLGYEIGQLLNWLEAAGAAADTMVNLELAYFPILEHFREPRALHAKLSSTPELFVEAVCSVCRGEHEPPSDAKPDPEVSRRARTCYALLRGWRRLPGTAEGEVVNGAALRAWVDAARRLLAERDRPEVGDIFIGELLSGSPPGADGVWPAEPVRDLLEDLANARIERAMATGKFNSRGVSMRGMYAGGTQEAALAKQFGTWAAQVQDGWPRTARVLRELADDYARGARREDSRAEGLADEG